VAPLAPLAPLASIAASVSDPSEVEMPLSASTGDCACWPSREYSRRIAPPNGEHETRAPWMRPRLMLAPGSGSSAGPIGRGVSGLGYVERGRRARGRQELARDLREEVGECPKGLGAMVDHGVRHWLGGGITGVGVGEPAAHGRPRGSCARPGRHGGEDVHHRWVQVLPGEHADSPWPGDRRIVKSRKPSVAEGSVDGMTPSCMTSAQR